MMNFHRSKYGGCFVYSNEALNFVGCFEYSNESLNLVGCFEYSNGNESLNLVGCFEYSNEGLNLVGCFEYSIEALVSYNLQQIFRLTEQIWSSAVTNGENTGFKCGDKL